MITLYTILFFAAIAAAWKAIVEVQRDRDEAEDRRQMRRAAVRFTERGIQ